MDKFMRFIALTLFTVIFVVGIAGWIMSRDSGQTKSASPIKEDIPKEQKVAEVTPASAWAYSTYKDSFTDSVVTLACITSWNTVEFEFPYNGGSSGRFCFRRRAGKLDSYFEVSKGQILCSYEGCNVQFRFDGGGVQSHPAAESRTHESNILFLTDPKALLPIFHRSKSVRIAAEFYQEGRQTFTFAIGGLDEKNL